jgi:hypothetical protein
MGRAAQLQSIVLAVSLFDFANTIISRKAIVNRSGVGRKLPCSRWKLSIAERLVSDAKLEEEIPVEPLHARKVVVD